MVKLIGAAKVAKRVSLSYTIYQRQAYDIMKHYAAEMMLYFDRVQAHKPKDVMGEFWTNRTFKAAEAFFAKSFVVPGRMGITVAYTPDPHYTKYLENSNNGRYSAIVPILERFEPLIFSELKYLFGDR